MMKKILIAEDSSVIQNLAKRVLEFSDYEIRLAKNGQEVLDLTTSETFDCIILDIIMPVMDGMECVRKLRQRDKNPNQKIPIIAISGNARNYSAAEFQQAGFTAFLAKPLDYDKLMDTVNILTGVI
jgi:CheY-like chemotaxis protein